MPGCQCISPILSGYKRVCNVIVEDIAVLFAVSAACTQLRPILKFESSRWMQCLPQVVLEAQQRHRNSLHCSFVTSPTSHSTLLPSQRKAATVARLARAYACSSVCDGISKRAPHSAAGIVLRAFLNGTEAAVKRPKSKVVLNPRDLRKFTQEVATMLKASDALGSHARCATC